MNKQTRLVGLLAAGTTLLVAAGVAVAATVTPISCDGGQCEGTEKPDRITGDASDNFIVAMARADVVYAGPGDDVVEGNRGNDRPGLSGDPGNVLEGGPGDDIVMGGLGEDKLEDVSPGDKDRLFGGGGQDRVDGMDGDSLDFLDCGDGKDFFRADSGDTVLHNCEEPF
jgi:Ca2+-binding RTX toxin-like protein